MKANKILLMAATLSMVACAKEIVQENANEDGTEARLVPITFYAGSEEEDPDATTGTRAVLGGEDFKTILWQDTDQLKIFDRVSNSLPEMTVSSGAGTKSATFSGSVTEGSEAPYYAVYPYQADATYSPDNLTIGSNTYTGGYLRVNLPTVQQAIANSVDPKAFLMVAKSTDGKTFQFKNLTAFVKFRLNAADVDGLEELSLSSNGLQAITGNIDLAFDSNGNVQQTYVNGTMQFYVTMKAPEGGFSSEVDYYFAIRYCNFSKGVTITGKYSDGSCRSIASSTGPTNNISRNMTLNLKTLPAMKKSLPNDLYIAYLHGHSIDVDGLVNKERYPESVLDPTNLYNDGRLNFISKDYSFSGVLGKMTVVGRYQSQKPQFTKTRIYLSEGGNVIFKNVTLDFSEYTNYAIGMSGSSDYTIDNFIFEDCDIKLPKDQHLTYLKQDTHNLDIKNAVLRNNKISVALSGDNKGVNIFNFKDEPITLQRIVVENNLIYTTTSYYAQGRILILGDTERASAARSSFSNNTLVNFGGNSQALVTFAHGQNQTMDFSNNLIVYTVSSNLTARLFTFNNYTSYSGSTIAVKDNKFYYTNAITWQLAGYWMTGVTKPTVSFTSEAANPFTADSNAATGKFVLTTAYRGCGSSLVEVESSQESE